MANLKKVMTAEEKARAFDMIIDAYYKESGLSQFGNEVQDIIKFLNAFNASRQ